MLIYEWRRYSAAVIALAMAGVLILALFGMFIGMGKAYTANVDRSRADIMILAPKADDLKQAGGLPGRIQPALYMNPEVAQVSQMEGDEALFTNTPPPGELQKSVYVDISAIDPYPGAASLPYDYTEATRRALLTPYNIAIDQTAQKTLGVKLGDVATLNGKAVTIGALLTNYPNMMDTQVVISRDTLRMIGLGSYGDKTGPLMVTLKHPERALQVRDELNAVANGKYRAWTRAELSKANESFIFKQQIVGIMLTFSVFLGLSIGIVITSLTLRGAILANIKELASLRALGVSMGSLRIVMLELSFWVGIVGLIVSAALVYGVSLLGKNSGLPMLFPAYSLIGTAGLLMTIALFSGALSLGLLKKSQPADLLR